MNITKIKYYKISEQNMGALKLLSLIILLILANASLLLFLFFLLIASGLLLLFIFTGKNYDKEVNDIIENITFSKGKSLLDNFNTQLVHEKYNIEKTERVYYFSDVSLFQNNFEKNISLTSAGVGIGGVSLNAGSAQINKRLELKLVDNGFLMVTSLGIYFIANNYKSSFIKYDEILAIENMGFKMILKIKNKNTEFFECTEKLPLFDFKVFSKSIFWAKNN